MLQGATTCHCIPGSYFDATSGGELLDNETVGCTVCTSVVPSESELVPKLICAGGAANATAMAAVEVYVIARPCTVTVDGVSQNVSCVTSYLSPPRRSRAGGHCAVGRHGPIRRAGPAAR